MNTELNQLLQEGVHYEDAERLFAPVKKLRGFASMSPEKRRAIASLGGRRASELGTGHRWNSQTAAIAGHKGGSAPHTRRPGRPPHNERERDALAQAFAETAVAETQAY